MSTPAITRFLELREKLSGAINNYQSIYGIPVDVYRLLDRATNKYVNVFGASQVTIKDPNSFVKVNTVNILNIPSELYNYLSINAEELLITLGTNDLLVGDILRFNFNGKTLDYTVEEPATTHHSALFQYKLKSNFNIHA